MGPPRPFIATSSVTRARVGQKDRPVCLETEAPCTSPKVDEEIVLDRLDEQKTDDDTTSTPQVVSSSDGDDITEEPKSEMEFNSFEDSLSYYKHYAKKCKFEVMTQMSERSEDQSVRYVTLGVHGKGRPRIRVSILPTHIRREQRTVREVSETMKRVLDTNDLAGIRLNKSYGSLVVGSGGFENLPFLKNDCCNYIYKARHLQLGAGGARALRDYFMRMQYKNNEFFELMDLDDDGRYGMPFTPFVGVNHHGQLILLGVGLISSDDMESFIWLFQT
ncbi:protein FAR-RED IMPAIRED RESPONSE 1-like [Juglans regia]|uniref:Protein FAR-RED IMPAIRED RESPONSE 1-like n=1 Tax=Juglans regia TaxID=51240 RepID=A0A6P9E3Z6_JUGRE|nr:protein FAR-RED IMPAIRED RESPONSE 1-like [Juglans regia]